MSLPKNELSLEVPSVDLECCILCQVCVDLAPHAFKMNDAGFIEVISLDSYSDPDIREAINNCPRTCIIME